MPLFSHIDNQHANGRKLLKKARYSKQGDRFGLSASSNAVPKGYMTSEEFRRLATEKVNKFCIRHFCN